MKPILKTRKTPYFRLSRLPVDFYRRDYHTPLSLPKDSKKSSFTDQRRNHRFLKGKCMTGKIHVLIRVVLYSLRMEEKTPDEDHYLSKPGEKGRWTLRDSPERPTSSFSPSLNTSKVILISGSKWSKDDLEFIKEDSDCNHLW